LRDRLNEALAEVKESLFFVSDAEAAKLSAALLLHGPNLVARFQEKHREAKVDADAVTALSRDKAIALVLQRCDQFKDELVRQKKRADDRASAKAAKEARDKEAAQQARDKEAANAAQVKEAATHGKALAKVARALDNDGDDGDASGGGGGGDNNVGRDLSCVVCLNGVRSICCVPCGHLALCSECAPRVNTCPVCRAVITQRIAVKVA